MTYSQINLTKVRGFLFLTALILLVGFQKEEPKCNVVIYSNGTTIFNPESCNPDFDKIYINLGEIPDNTSISSVELYLFVNNLTELPPKQYLNVTYEVSADSSQS